MPCRSTVPAEALLQFGGNGTALTFSGNGTIATGLTTGLPAGAVVTLQTNNTPMAPATTFSGVLANGTGSGVPGTLTVRRRHHLHRGQHLQRRHHRCGGKLTLTNGSLAMLTRRPAVAELRRHPGKRHDHVQHNVQR